MRMPEQVPSIDGVDVEAVQQAVDLLTDEDFQVVAVDGIDRDSSDETSVRWTMTVEKDARTSSLSDFDMGER